MIVAGWWIADKAYQKFYIDAEKKPFWSGTEEVQVCKVPYYSSSECKRLKVELVDNNHARIHYLVTKKVREQTEDVPTEEQFKQAYWNAIMDNNKEAADMIKDADEFLHPEKNVTVEQQLDVSNVECWFAGYVRYVFCRGWDRDGQQWEFHPASVNF